MTKTYVLKQNDVGIWRDVQHAAKENNNTHSWDYKIDI